MDQDTTLYGGTPGPKRHCVMGTQLPFPKIGTQSPNFRPMSTVAKRLDGSRWHFVWIGLGPGHIVLGQLRSADRIPLKLDDGWAYASMQNTEICLH